MTLRTTKQTNRRPGGSRAFTLIELILVMAILLIAVSMVAPQMGSFFRGRALEAEARRFMTLTRYGQSRAVAEGIPVILWVDQTSRAYGLEIQPGYTTARDDKAVEYELGADLQIEAGRPRSIYGDTIRNSMRGLQKNLPTIRFTPDGFISEMSPETIYLTNESGELLIVAPNRTRLSYEIKSEDEYYALQF